MDTVKVIIVDDSAVFRTVMKAQLTKFPGIEVIALAGDAYEARDLIVDLKPDVITLDMEMPKMSGLEFIGILMEHWPMPIVVLSSLVGGKNEKLGLKALEMGAAALFPKPDAESMTVKMEELRSLLKSLKGWKPKPTKASIISPLEKLLQTNHDRLIVIGASTGGTEAIKEVLSRLPTDCPGVVVVQHMPSGFTKSFADRLNEICTHLQVKEATNGDLVQDGCVLIAPGGFQMSLKKSEHGYAVVLKKGELVNRHMPSVEVIFNSAAEVAGSKAVGAILTGMGADGAKGMLNLRNAGGRCIAQDEATSVVYGMPKEALALGGAEKAVPLTEIAQALVKLL